MSFLYNGIFMNNAKDIMVVKMDKDGNMLWNSPDFTRSFGGGFDESVQGMVALSNGNVLILGTSKSYTSATPNGSRRAAMALCMSGSGNFVWARFLGGSGTSAEMARRGVELNNGYVAITGLTNLFGAGGDDILYWVLKLDGSFHLAKAFGTGRNDQGFDIGFAYKNTTNPSYIDICGKTMYSLANGNPNEESPLWLRLGYSTAPTSQTSQTSYQITDPTGTYDLDKARRVLNNLQNVHIAGTAQGYGSFLYKHNSNPTSVAYAKQSGESDVVGLLHSSGVPKYVVTKENNGGENTYLTLTDENLELDLCESQSAQLSVSTMSNISVQTLSSSTPYFVVSPVMSYIIQGDPVSGNPSIQGNGKCLDNGQNYLYTQCLDANFSGFDKLRPAEITPTSSGNVAMLSRRSSVQYASNIDYKMSVAKIGSDGDILSENTYSLPKIGGVYKQAFEPVSFVEVSSNKYWVLGQYAYEYNDNGTVRTEQDVMLVQLNGGSVDWAKKFHFNTTNVSDGASKIIKMYSSTGVHNGYAVLAWSLTNGKKDTRVMKLDLSGTVTWSRAVVPTTLYGGGTVYAWDILQLGDGGDLVIGGSSSAIYYYGFAGFLMKISNSGTLRWVKCYGTTQTWGNPPNTTTQHTTVHFMEFAYDGTDIVVLFQTSVKHGIVHIAKATGFVQSLGSGIDKSFVFNQNLNIKDFKLDGQNYLFSGTRSYDAVAFSATMGLSENWSKKVEIPKSQTVRDLTIQGSDFWVAGTSANTTLTCGSTFSYIDHQFAAKGSLTGGPEGCVYDLDNVNLSRVEINSYDPAFGEDSRWQFLNVAPWVNTFDEEVFAVSTTVTPKAYACNNLAIGYEPYSEEDDDDWRVEANETDDEISLADESPSNTGLKVYPNPATNFLTIRTADLTATGRIVSMDGRVVVSDLSLKEGDNQIDISELTPGQYILHFNGEKGVHTTKFMKE